MSTCYSLLLGCVCSSVWSFGSPFVIAGVKSLHVSPKCTSHIILCSYLWAISSSERPQQNKTSPSPFPLLILPTLHSASQCEGRKYIVLGMCSLLSSLSHFLLFLLLFVPQYGRLAAVLKTGVKSLRMSPKCTSHIIF